MTPKQKLFSIAEHLHFYYEMREAKDFKKYIQQTKTSLGASLDSGLRRMLKDITILLEGDDKAPGYEAAFQRYIKYYSGFSAEQLIDYYWFIRNLGVKPPETKAQIKPEPKYVMSPDLQKIINSARHDDYDDDFDNYVPDPDDDAPF